MRGIPGQKQRSKSHWLGHKAPQRRDAFFDARPGHQMVPCFRVQTIAKFIPEGFIRPLIQMVGQRHLQVITATRATPLRAQRKTSRTIDVNEFLMDRRGIGQHTQPAKGVDLLKLLNRLAGNARSANAMKSVATRNEVTLDGLGNPVLNESHAWVVAIEVMDLHRLRFVVRCESCGFACLHQVPGDFGLAIHHDLFPTRQALEVNPMAFALEEQIKSGVGQSVLGQAFVYAGLCQHVEGDLFKNAGPNSAQHIVGRLALDDDGVYASFEKELSQQQTRRACTDNDDIGTHLARLGNLAG